MATSAVIQEKRIIPHTEANGSDIIGIGEYTYIIRSDLDCCLRVQDLEKGKDGKTGPTLLPLHQHCKNGDHYFATKTEGKLTPEQIKEILEKPVPELGWGQKVALGVFYPNFYQQPLPAINMVAAAVNVAGAAVNVAGVQRQIQEAERRLPDRDRFYILKDDKYQIVRDLVTGGRDTDGVIHNESCRGGDFYMANRKEVVMIKDDKFYEIRSYGWTDSWCGRISGPYDLSTKCKGGLYYWATEKKIENNELKTTYHVLKGFDVWGAVMVHCTDDLRTDRGGKDIVLHVSVSNFVPGGLSFNTTGKWICLQSDRNDSNTPTEWKYLRSTKIGYNKEVVHSIQSNWKLEGEISVGYEGGLGLIADQLFKHTVKAQFTVGGGLGGYEDNTTHTTDSTETTNTIEKSGTLKPGEEAHIWQYVIKKVTEHEEKNLVFTPHLAKTDSKKPPTHVPLVDEQSFFRDK